MERQSGVQWAERPESFEVFAGLPAALRLLRMEVGKSPEQLDVRLGLTRGTYASYEWALTAPLLGGLDRFLVLFDLGLTGLQQKLRAMQKIDWPPGGDGGGEEPEKEAAWPSAEEFARAREVIHGFEELSRGPSRRQAHPVASFGESLFWLRVFFGLSSDELADIAGLSPATIRAHEPGGRTPRSDTSYLIARNLQTPFNQRLICAGHFGVRAFWSPPRH